MLGKKSKAYISIEGCIKEVLEGLIVSIDPSIGSSSSQPGWAVYREGNLLHKGTFSIEPTKSIPGRLQDLHNYVRKLYNKYPPDVLIYEDIPAQRQGGGNAVAHSSLLKAVGAILAVPGPRKHVGIMPISWKSEARATYVKSDVNDAIEMGYVVIQVARRILNG